MKTWRNIQIVMLFLFSSPLLACPFDVEVNFISEKENNLNLTIEVGDKFSISSCDGENQEIAEVKTESMVYMSQGTEFDGSNMTRLEAKEKIKDISLMLITNSGVRVKTNSPNQSLKHGTPQSGAP